MLYAFLSLVLLSIICSTALFLHNRRKNNLPRFYGEEGEWFIKTMFEKHKYPSKDLIKNESFFDWYEKKDIMPGYLWPHHGEYALEYKDTKHKIF